MKIRLRPSQSMHWMMNDINIFSSAHIHSRPRSTSSPGRLQIKPSGSPLNHKRAFSKTLHHGDCFQKMRFWCPKNLRNIYRYAWTRPGGDQGSNFRTKKRTQKWQENSANLERKRRRGGTKGWVHSFLAAESRKEGLANWLVATLLAASPKQYSTPTLIKLQNYLSSFSNKFSLQKGSYMTAERALM